MIAIEIIRQLVYFSTIFTTNIELDCFKNAPEQSNLSFKMCASSQLKEKYLKKND